MKFDSHFLAWGNGNVHSFYVNVNPRDLNGKLYIDLDASIEFQQTRAFITATAIVLRFIVNILLLL
jgi:hypothetical protein